MTRAQTLLLLIVTSALYLSRSQLGHAGEFRAARASTRPPASHYRLESLIRRDPFDGAPRPMATSTLPFDQNDVDIASVDSEDVQDTTAAPTTLLLKATIVGPSPVAYVADGQTMHVVATGDYLAGRRVVEIDATGIVFDDATRLELSGVYAPPRGPTVPTIEQSRRPKRAAATPTAAAASATAAQTIASPAPLPTIKRGAFPLNGSPTSDASAPTAFPYPYPYAPR